MGILQNLFGIKESEKRSKSSVLNELDKASKLGKDPLDLARRPYSAYASDASSDKYFAFGEFYDEICESEAGLSEPHESEALRKGKAFEGALDLTDRAVRDDLKIAYQDLLFGDGAATSRVAELARQKGHRAIVAPSPRVAGGKILVVFGKQHLL